MAQRIALGVYVVCFTIGTLSHAREFWALGLPLQAAFLGLVLGSIGFLWPAREQAA